MPSEAPTRNSLFFNDLRLYRRIWTLVGQFENHEKSLQ